MEGSLEAPELSTLSVNLSGFPNSFQQRERDQWFVSPPNHPIQSSPLFSTSLVPSRANFGGLGGPTISGYRFLQSLSIEAFQWTGCYLPSPATQLYRTQPPNAKSPMLHMMLAMDFCVDDFCCFVLFL